MLDVDLMRPLRRGFALGHVAHGMAVKQNIGFVLCEERFSPPGILKRERRPLPDGPAAITRSNKGQYGFGIKPCQIEAKNRRGAEKWGGLSHEGAAASAKWREMIVGNFSRCAITHQFFLRKDCSVTAVVAVEHGFAQRRKNDRS